MRIFSRIESAGDFKLKPGLKTGIAAVVRGSEAGVRGLDKDGRFWAFAARLPRLAIMKAVDTSSARNDFIAPF